ncbi:lysine--tRNA ligase [Glacieibacterium frigidum]|uniref:Lysine--tRNA ligase n=1 Tax=Glacieibacterium frigidum TaxID=2593303 RepID=A0A552UG17_9SPHN|nr:lysine--tRNA ligase [Glacieibacterium frigidum]TRW17131.1 lysine--tRNA ligase [Glacieibacterium frigidum]
MTADDTLRDAARVSKAWPFEEARKLVARYPQGFPEAGVVFETGYGPSGLPHIGTFGEVARTTMVRRAFEVIAPGVQTRLIAFSDDMDGFRKVPPALPQQEMLRAHLGQPLTRVPDPFGTHDSFGAHNNARLRTFLDQFGFEYEFLSSTDCYASGRFDATLLRVLEHYDAVTGVILPTLGPERRATYSPFLPLHPVTGEVLQVPLTGRDVAAGTISFVDAEGESFTVPVTGGHAKLQWKVDWAMRWVALGVDYEMAGKDLIDSVTLSGAVTRVLGSRPPEGFNYELFLDAEGTKISKSKGNGLTIDEWLTYASPDSLALYMYQNPRKAKRLHFDVIPKAVEEYYSFLSAYPGQPIEQQLGNPVFHIHHGGPPATDLPLSFGLLLNLVTVAGTDDPAVLWGFVSRYVPGTSAATHPEVDALVRYAIAYARDFVLPGLQRRKPDAQEAAALADLDRRLAALGPDADAEAFQFEVYETGKAHGFEPLRNWFKALYETLLGTAQGPRMGSFIKLYGLAETRRLISETLS